jgi:hypothetical protein
MIRLSAGAIVLSTSLLLMAGCGASTLVTGDPCHLRNGGCDGHATCTNNNGASACACMTGFTGDGLSCVDRNECVESPGICAKDAFCTNTPGSFTCDCNAGFQGNGLTGSALVCTATNPCLTSNGGCDANATCANASGTSSCTCSAPHWQGDGRTCTPADCATNHGGCDLNASCSGQGASLVCTCQAGYIGDGQTCMPIVCMKNNGGCDANATCSGQGTTIMCACNSGYTGDGTKGHCAASCALPWGGTLAHGSTATAYQASSVGCGSSCASETLTCSNGTLGGGSYQYGACSVAACDCPALTVNFDWGTEGSGPCQVSLPAGNSSNWYYTNTTDSSVGALYADCNAGTWQFTQEKCVPRGASTTCFVVSVQGLNRPRGIDNADHP